MLRRKQLAEPDHIFTLFPHVAAFELEGRLEILRIDTDQTAIPIQYKTSPTDIGVLTIEEAALLDIPRYELSNIESALETVIFVGYGASGGGVEGAVEGFDDQPTKRAGLIRYESLRDGPPYPGIEMLVYDFDRGTAKHNTLANIGYESDLGYGPEEVLAGRGDSDAPVFLLNGSIAGVTAFGGRLDDAPDESFGTVSFDIPVASFQGLISAATNGSAVFAPEPNASLIFVLCVRAVAPPPSLVRRSMLRRFDI